MLAHPESTVNKRFPSAICLPMLAVRPVLLRKVPAKRGALFKTTKLPRRDIGGSLLGVRRKCDSRSQARLLCPDSLTGGRLVVPFAKTLWQRWVTICVMKLAEARTKRSVPCHDCSDDERGYRTWRS